MKWKFVLCGILICSQIPARLDALSKRQVATKVLTLVVAHGAAAFDAYTTDRFLKRRYTEANPVFKPFIKSPGWKPYVVLQVPIVAVDLLATTKHKKAVRRLRIFEFVSNVGCGIWNLRLR